MYVTPCPGVRISVPRPVVRCLKIYVVTSDVFFILILKLPEWTLEGVDFRFFLNWYVGPLCGKYRQKNHVLEKANKVNCQIFCLIWFLKIPPCWVKNEKMNSMCSNESTYWSQNLKRNWKNIEIWIAKKIFFSMKIIRVFIKQVFLLRNQSYINIFLFSLQICDRWIHTVLLSYCKLN